MAARFRSILHRVLSETRMDPPKDDSRPLYPRPKYCIGICLDALDARPDKNTTVGSQHAFMMAVMDKMLEHLRGLDLAKVKGLLEKRNIGDGMILLGFKHGCVLEVTFDTVESLTNIWTIHKKNRLTSYVQDALVDKALLKVVNSTKLTLRAKLWEDEYEACKEEILGRDATSRVPLTSLKQDYDMVKRIREFQKTMPEITGKARDAESAFEHHLGELMLTVKQILPQSTTVIRNVKEFATNVKVARGVQKVNFNRIDHLLLSLEFFKRTFEDIQREIVFPLCQIRVQCENANQRNLKKTIKSACSEMLNVLKPETDLQKVKHKEWESKVLQREQGLFYGLISLIPMSMDRLTTIDYSADEYINNFPEMAD